MIPIDAGTAAQLERIEAEAWSSIQLNMPAALSGRFGVTVSRIAGAVALQASRTDIVMLNRVIGLGFSPPLSERLLDDVIGLYRENGIAKFLISWSPFASPSPAAEWMAARGFIALGALAKLYRRAGKPLHNAAGLPVIEIDESRAAEYGALVARAHGDPPELAAAHAATVGLPGWRHYLVEVDGQPLAGACLFQRDGLAWCGFAATLPAYRRGGAHAALLARRSRDAVRAGAELIACEAVPETAERPSPSYRNMPRAGFQLAYSRPNLLYHGDGQRVHTVRHPA